MCLGLLGLPAFSILPLCLFTDLFTPSVSSRRSLSYHRLSLWFPFPSPLSFFSTSKGTALPTLLEPLLLSFYHQEPDLLHSRSVACFLYYFSFSILGLIICLRFISPSLSCSSVKDCCVSLSCNCSFTFFLLSYHSAFPYCSVHSSSPYFSYSRRVAVVCLYQVNVHTL